MAVARPAEQTRAELEAAAERRLAENELCRRRLLPFTTRFTPRYNPGWLHLDICERLEKFSRDVAEEKNPRLMLFVPPRHGKSQICSRTFPAWHLGHYPWHEFISTSYSGTLAMSFSRYVRGVLRDPNYHEIFDTRLSQDTQSAELWKTTDNGQYLAAGVGGPMTGNGAHILLIDDPVKNIEEADSATVRQSTWDWYTSTAYTRLAPGGGILLVMTRWNFDDLAGRLIADMMTGDEFAEKWEIILYPAVATKDERFRLKGEPLHKDRFDLRRLKKIERTLGPRQWAALYQQTPVADSGSFFESRYFTYYRPESRPPLSEMEIYQAWDLAVGEKEQADYSVGITVGMDQQSRIWVLDCQHGRWHSMELCERILDMQKTWGAYSVGMEDGQIRMSIGPFLNQMIREREQWGFVHEPLKPGKRDKVARARSIQGRMQQGMVLFPHPENAPWMPEFVNEFLAFPAGKHDDRVDAMAWIGLLLEQMLEFRPDQPEPPKSWRDKLNQYTGKTDVDGSSHMAA